MRQLLKILTLSLMLSAATMLSAAAADHIGTGTVTGSGLRLRSQANTSCEVLASLEKGSTLKVLEVLDGWYRVSTEEKEGFVSAQYLVYTDLEGNTVSPEEYGMVTGSTVNVRKGPGTGYEKLSSLTSGTRVKILEKLDGWYKISKDDITGYMSADYVSLLNGDTSIGQQVVELAMEYLGYKYTSAGASPKTGFDCSGLAMYLYAQFGYDIPHSSKTLAKTGLSITKDELQPGDLVFFRSASSSAVSHVGIYIGNGDIIHARYSVKKVCINNLSESYYSKYYLHSMRIVY